MAKQNPDKLRFNVSMDLMTVDDLVALEDDLSLKNLRDLLARFIEDEETGQYLSQEEGIKIVGALSINQLMKYKDQLEHQFAAIKDGLAGPK